MGREQEFVKRVARGVVLRDRYRTPKPHVHVCRRCGHLFRGCLCSRRMRADIPEERGCVVCDLATVRRAVKEPHPTDVYGGASVRWLVSRTGMTEARVHRAMKRATRGG